MKNSHKAKNKERNPRDKKDVFYACDDRNCCFFSRTHKIFVAKEKGIFYMFGSYHTGTTHHRRRLFRCEFAF